MDKEIHHSFVVPEFTPLPEELINQFEAVRRDNCSSELSVELYNGVPQAENFPVDFNTYVELMGVGSTELVCEKSMNSGAYFRAPSWHIDRQGIGSVKLFASSCTARFACFDLVVPESLMITAGISYRDDNLTFNGVHELLKLTYNSHHSHFPKVRWLAATIEGEGQIPRLPKGVQINNLHFVSNDPYVIASGACARLLHTSTHRQEGGPDSRIFGRSFY